MGSASHELKSDRGDIRLIKLVGYTNFCYPEKTCVLDAESLLAIPFPAKVQSKE